MTKTPLEKPVVEEVNPDDPWLCDKLERKAVADYLTPVIASIRQPFVVSLHSPYGTGKSFFLKCWKRDLELRGFKTVLFNAWETDFSQDALSAFMVSLKRQLAKDEDTKRKLVDLAKKAGGFARAKMAPALIKGLASKAVGTEAVDDITAGFKAIGLSEEALGDILSSAAVEALATQEVAENAMDAFRQYLEKIVADIVDQTPECDPDYLWENIEGRQKEDRRKLIIFVDELDRCRPTYAVEVLECIKHLFAVDGIVFVLAIDDEQMKSAIASTYGLRLDGEGYLRKFIDWQFLLPEPSGRAYGEFLYDYFKMDEIPVIKKEGSSRSEVADAVDLLSCGFGMSLRQISHVLTVARLTWVQLPDHVTGFCWLTVVVVGLEFCIPEAFKDAASDFIAAEGLLADIEKRLRVSSSLPLNWNDEIRNYFLKALMTTRSSSVIGARAIKLQDERLKFESEYPAKESKIRRLRKEEEGWYRLQKAADHLRKEFGTGNLSLVQVVQKRIAGAKGYVAT